MEVVRIENDEERAVRERRELRRKAGLDGPRTEVTDHDKVGIWNAISRDGRRYAVVVGEKT